MHIVCSIFYDFKNVMLFFIIIILMMHIFVPTCYRCRSYGEETKIKDNCW